MYFSRCLLALAAAAAMSALALAADPDASGMTVAMNAQNDSNETGTATLRQTGKDVQVTIDLQNAPAAPQPAHIHPGTCAKLNPAPKYPLNNVVSGKSTTTLKNVDLADLTSGGFAVNVHKSTSDLATYVSCGDITATPTPAPEMSP